MAHTVNNNGLEFLCWGGEGLSPVGDDALGKCWRSSDRRASLGSGGYPPTQWANQPLGNPKHPSRERNPALLDAFFISTSTFSANRAFSRQIQQC